MHCVICSTLCIYFTLLFKFEVFGRLFILEIDKLVLNLYEGIKSQNIPEEGDGEIYAYQV